MELAPDWVCEIVSPGHERKDILTLLLLMLRHRLPYDWLMRRAGPFVRPVLTQGFTVNVNVAFGRPCNNR